MRRPMGARSWSLTRGPDQGVLGRVSARWRRRVMRPGGGWESVGEVEGGVGEGDGAGEHGAAGFEGKVEDGFGEWGRGVGDLELEAVGAPPAAEGGGPVVVAFVGDDGLWALDEGIEEVA